MKTWEKGDRNLNILKIEVCKDNEKRQFFLVWLYVDIRL